MDEKKNGFDTIKTNKLKHDNDDHNDYDITTFPGDTNEPLIPYDFLLSCGLGMLAGFVSAYFINSSIEHAKSI